MEAMARRFSGWSSDGGEEKNDLEEERGRGRHPGDDVDDLRRPRPSQFMQDALAAGRPEGEVPWGGAGGDYDEGGDYDDYDDEDVDDVGDEGLLPPPDAQAQAFSWGPLPDSTPADGDGIKWGYGGFGGGGGGGGGRGGGRRDAAVNLDRPSEEPLGRGGGVGVNREMGGEGSPAHGNEQHGAGRPSGDGEGPLRRSGGVVVNWDMGGEGSPARGNEQHGAGRPSGEPLRRSGRVGVNWDMGGEGSPARANSGEPLGRGGGVGVNWEMGGEGSPARGDEQRGGASSPPNRVSVAGKNMKQSAERYKQMRDATEAKRLTAAGTRHSGARGGGGGYGHPGSPGGGDAGMGTEWDMRNSTANAEEEFYWLEYERAAAAEALALAPQRALEEARAILAEANSSDEDLLRPEAREGEEEYVDEVEEMRRSFAGGAGVLSAWGIPPLQPTAGLCACCRIQL
jgi:hypothetical protein